jgi:hypothetical protein
MDEEGFIKTGHENEHNQNNIITNPTSTGHTTLPLPTVSQYTGPGSNQSQPEVRIDSGPVENQIQNQQRGNNEQQVFIRQVHYQENACMSLFEPFCVSLHCSDEDSLRQISCFVYRCIVLSFNVINWYLYRYRTLVYVLVFD